MASAAGIGIALGAFGCGSAVESNAQAGSDALAQHDATSLAAASNIAQILIGEIAQDQIDAVEQLRQESKVTDPPNPNAALVQAIAGLALEIALGRIADVATAFLVPGASEAESTAATKIVGTIFERLDTAIVESVSSDIQARTGPGVSVVDAFFMGMKDALQTAKTEQLVDFNLTQYPELLAIADEASQLRAANAIVRKLRQSYGGKNTGPAFQAQYGTTLTQYCVLLARTSKGVDGKDGTDLGADGSDSGVLHVMVSVDNSGATAGGEHDAAMVTGGARIHGLNENLRAKLDTAGRTVGSLGLPVYIDGVYTPSPLTPYADPTRFLIGRNETGKIYLVPIDPFDSLVSSQRDFLVWLAAKGGKTDTRDSATLLADAERGAAKLFADVDRLKLDTPQD